MKPPHKPARSEFLQLRGLRRHIHQWGDPFTPWMFMLPGWMELSASLQFVVDRLRQDWHVIAPDWRCFGLSERSGRDAYWFSDYLADLDAVLTHYSPHEPMHLLGHSTCGNAAAMYTGIRPERVARLINLKGFGLADREPEDAPEHYAGWLDQLRTPAHVRDYTDLRDLVLRLQCNNPRLNDERAAFLGQNWAVRNAQGRCEILGDPLHKNLNLILFRAAEMLACWQRIGARVLWVEGAEMRMANIMGGKLEARAEFDRRRSHIAQVRTVILNDAGHILHHDQQELLALEIENFLS